MIPSRIARVIGGVTRSVGRGGCPYRERETSLTQRRDFGRDRAASNSFGCRLSQLPARRGPLEAPVAQRERKTLDQSAIQTAGRPTHPQQTGCSSLLRRFASWNRAPTYSRASAELVRCSKPLGTTRTIGTDRATPFRRFPRQRRKQVTVL